MLAISPKGDYIWLQKTVLC